MQKEVSGKQDPKVIYQLIYLFSSDKKCLSCPVIEISTYSYQVLLLTMDDESSSGVNLTTANHAVFVHPLLAIGQQQYDAYETQVLKRT